MKREPGRAQQRIRFRVKYQPYQDFSTHTVVSSGSKLATTKKRLMGVTTQGKDERPWKNRKNNAEWKSAGNL